MASRLEATEGSRTLDKRVAFALVYTALVLSVTEYWLLPFRSPATGLPQRIPLPLDLAGALVWVASTLVFFLLLPALVVRFVHRQPLSAVGYGAAGLVRHLPVYLLLYALMLPILYLVSRRPEFLAVYPFPPSARRSVPAFLVWELAYAAQFVALESFFRGYLLFTCAARMGPNAVPVMVVPYTMIHFHKPFLECLGAVGAGCVLGVLALRYRTFWGGALLHILVAVTMDLLAVTRAGLLVWSG
jgi:hypothetical protein